MLNSFEKIILAIVIFFVKVLYSTLKIKRVNFHYRQQAELARKPKGFLLAIWHEDFPASLASGLGDPYTAIVSLSKDGEMASRFIEGLGYKKMIRGSSSRGGKEARDKAEEALSAGQFIVVTVDGPRGPRHEVKPGIVDIARKNDVMILPMVALPSRYWTLKSWDRCRIPKPFSTIYQIFGEPFFVPADTKDQAFIEVKQRIKKKLTELELVPPH